MDCGKDDFMRQRCGEWTIDAAERIAKDTREQNQLILENAIRNKANKIVTTNAFK